MWVVEFAKQFYFKLESFAARVSQLKLKFDCVTVPGELLVAFVDNGVAAGRDALANEIALTIIAFDVSSIV